MGLLCKGSNGDYVTVGTSDPKQGCKGSERMTITDGTEGSMTGCGKFSFKEILRIPRNGGTDLYLSYMGSSDGICLAVCARDVTTRHAGVKQGLLCDAPQKLHSGLGYNTIAFIAVINLKAAKATNFFC